MGLQCFISFCLGSVFTVFVIGMCAIFAPFVGDAGGDANPSTRPYDIP